MRENGPHMTYYFLLILVNVRGFTIHKICKIYYVWCLITELENENKINILFIR